MINLQQVKALMSEPAHKRYEHFVHRVADFEEVWGLYDNGWALASTNDGKPVFPVWPGKEYAEECATGDWSQHTATAIPLQDFLDEVLPKLRRDGVELGVFYTPQNEGVLPGIDRVLGDIHNELKSYESSR
jgi:hypothetical protein